MKTLGRFEQALAKYRDFIVKTDDPPIDRMLPILLQLQGKPYNLSWSHFMFEPIFRIKNMPRMLLLKAARQTGKSMSMSAAQILRAAMVSHYNILTILPLQSQTQRFSNNYVKPFLTTSPLRNTLLLDKDAIDSVLQRSFKNGSNLFYSYTQGEPNRVRGINASEVDFDELADLEVEDIPIVEQCMGASIHKVMRFGGTPKTFDNTVEVYWKDCSQAHWHIICDNPSCRHDNKCCVENVDGNIIDMIGEKTLVCARCKTPVNSRAGFWVHDQPEKQKTFAGYHIPQPILPLHYEIPSNWHILREFMRTKPTYAFYNEVLGESYDTGAKIITASDLAEASKEVVPCEPHEFIGGGYIMSAVGVDWGGRGKEKASDTDEFISNTAIALGGLRTDGVIEVKWLHKIAYTTDVMQEAPMVANVAMQARVDWCAMDYGGQGDLREQMVIGAGWPRERVVPFTYSVMSPRNPIVFYNPPAARGVRTSYTLDKPRSILLLCELIRRKQILLPNKDTYRNDHFKDFLNIFEESVDNPRGSPSRLIKRLSGRHDDVVHAINFLVMALYHANGRWPEIAKAFITE